MKKNRKISACYILVLLVYTMHVFSQSPVLKNFTIKDGLPSNELYNIYQDTKGYIWICTDAGLVKYDANTFRTFNSSDGLPDNTVFEVKEDKLGRIWYRTFSGNIGYVLNDKVYVIAANESIIEFQGGGIICSFLIDDQNNVILGRQSAEVSAFLKIKPPYTMADVSLIHQNPNKHAWLDILLFGKNDFVYAERRAMEVTDTRGISIYNNKYELQIHDNVPLKSVPSSLTRMYRKGNRFVLGNDFLIKEYDFVTNLTKTKFLNDAIINVYKSKSDKFIVSYRDRGITELDKDLNPLPSPLQLMNLSNSAILEDNNSGVWYCTLKNGLFYTNNLNYKMYDGSNNTMKPVKFFKPLEDDKFVVGLEGDGCFLYKKEKGAMNLMADINIYTGNDFFVRSLKEIKPGILFISYTYHNHLYDYKKQRISLVGTAKTNQFTFSELFFYKKNFLGYGYNAATVFDSLDYSLKYKVQSNDRITSFAYNASSNEAFFGAIHGLYKFYGQTKITEKDKVSNFRVKDLRYLNNRLFIATKGYGLVVRSGSTSDTIGLENGLLSNVCEKIAIDGNKCWVSSNLGLSCITYLGYKYYDIVNYPLKDFGTPSLIQDFFIKDSVLYFASASMLYSYPLVETEESSTPFYIYKMEVNNRIVQYRREHELEYDQSNVKVYFAALYYNFRGSVKYRYKLLPNDKDWVYTNENSVLFPSLSSGAYQLVLQAQKNDGSWIECNEKISFAIQKPFWRKWWFVFGSLVVIIISVSYITFSFYRIKVSRELVKSKIRISLYNLEIKAMKAQMNPHFIFNSLNSIQHFILANENENAYKYLSKFSKLVRMLLESNIKESLLVETEIEILKKYLEIESLRFKESFSYEFTIDPAISAGSKIPHMMIQPFVENAIWHGLLHKKENRVLKITFVQKHDKLIECSIEDNGVGIKQSIQSARDDFKEKSLALEFIKERLQLFSNTLGVKYKLSIEDKSERGTNETGTLVIINLPVLEN